MRRSYKVVGMGGKSKDGGYHSYSISIPRELGHLLHKQGTEFKLELTEEGLLYKPVDFASDLERYPSWVKDEEADD